MFYDEQDLVKKYFALHFFKQILQLSHRTNLSKNSFSIGTIANTLNLSCDIVLQSKFLVNFNLEKLISAEATVTGSADPNILGTRSNLTIELSTPLTRVLGAANSDHCRSFTSFLETL